MRVEFFLFCIVLSCSSFGYGHGLKFKINTALLNFSTAANVSKKCNEANVMFFSLSDECHNCDFQEIQDNVTKDDEFLVDTRWPLTVKLEYFCSSANVSCSVKRKYHYGERGSYTIQFGVNMSETNQVTCRINELVINKKPVKANLPILVAFVVFLAMAIVYAIYSVIENKTKSKSTVTLDKFINSDLGNAFHSPPISSECNESTSTSETQPIIQPKILMVKERLRSVDTFRGLCIVIMIFVNYGGGRYWFFTHSVWNGLTVADLVFPWFMYIMGVNIILSIDSQVTKAVPLTSIIYKIIRRTIILFSLGIFIINHSQAWYNMRVPGVLQRFAGAYFIIAFLQLFFHVSNDKLQEYVQVSQYNLAPRWYVVRDVVLYWQQWLIILSLEVVWHTLTFALPVPGCPKGYLGPGGFANNGSYFNCTGGAAGYIDKVIFKDIHLFTNPTCKSIYFPKNYGQLYYDPEGLLGTIHSCLIVFLGLQAGKIFYYFKTPKERIVRFLAWFILLGAISGGLTGFSLNDGVIPVNKNLWSTSFVTTLSSMAFFLLPVFYVIVDVKKLWSGVPLFFVGMNSILLYMGHEIFESYLPFSWGANENSTHSEWLAMNLLGVSYWVLVAYYCYRIKFFLKI